jgi:predicted DNA-binding transcriptional regulator AlpA
MGHRIQPSEPPQLALARKAAKLKADAKKKKRPPQLTRRDIEELNRKAQLAAEAFKEEEQEAQPRLLTKPEVLKRVGLTFPTIWKRMRSGTFPRARVNGGKVVWLETEIDTWMKSLPLQKYKGDPEEATA